MSSQKNEVVGERHGYGKPAFGKWEQSLTRDRYVGCVTWVALHVLQGSWLRTDLCVLGGRGACGFLTASFSPVGGQMVVCIKVPVYEACVTG